jgi:hypothetical protein
MFFIASNFFVVKLFLLVGHIKGIGPKVYRFLSWHQNKSLLWNFVFFFFFTLKALSLQNFGCFCYIEGVFNYEVLWIFFVIWTKMWNSTNFMGIFPFFFRCSFCVHLFFSNIFVGCHVASIGYLQSFGFFLCCCYILLYGLYVYLCIMLQLIIMNFIITKYLV